VLPFDNPTGTNLAGMALSETLSDSVSAKVREDSSEFVRLVERAALDQVLAEQGLTTSGVASGTVGKVRGVRYLVLGRLTQVRAERPSPTATRKTIAGQEPYPCQRQMSDGRVIDATCWRDINVSYVEHAARVSVRIAGSVKVVDTKTGEQVAAAELEGSQTDSVAYADSFTRTGNGQPVDYEPLNLTNEFRRLAKARQVLKDEGELLPAVLQKITETAAEAVEGVVDVEKTATDPAKLVLVALP